MIDKLCNFAAVNNTIMQRTDTACIRELSNFLLDFGTKLMASGAHTARVERNLERIAKSFGYSAEMVIFQRHFTLTLFLDTDDSVRRTTVRTIGAYHNNFDTISQLSGLSWDTYDNKLPFGELQERFAAIIAKKRMPKATVIFLVSIANAAFCRLFGGDIIGAGLVLVATAAGFSVRQWMLDRHINHMAMVIVSAFAASMVAAVGIWQGWGTTPQTALATSVLFLIPGVPLINSIIDIIDGHMLIGISRMMNAMVTLICIVLGLSATMLIFRVDLL